MHSFVHGLLICMGLVAGAEGAVLNMRWEPEKFKNYCESLPKTYKYPDPVQFPPVSNGDGYTCQRFLGTQLTFSPDEYVDLSMGGITLPKPTTSTCDDQMKCEGKLNMTLADADGLAFTWAAGTDSDSNFEFHPPLGTMLAVFSLSSPMCTGSAKTSNKAGLKELGGNCTVQGLPEDWIPVSDESVFLTLGDGKISVAMELYSYRGGVTVRLPSFGLKCDWDPALLPDGCGANQIWSYQLENRIRAGYPTGITPPAAYHNDIRKQEGVSMIHPFNDVKLVVRKGLPVSADPCNDHADIFACNRDGGTQGPCAWNGTNCNIDKAPTVTPTADSIGIDDALFEFSFPSWGSGFETVRAFYWTVGSNESDAMEPSMPDAKATGPQSYVCKVPCSLVWSSPGNFTIKVIAHLEASLAGRFRDVFYSAMATKSFEIIPNPTPMPTPVPTAPPTPNPTPGASTPGPTPVPTAPETDAPTPIPTPLPKTPLPTPLPPFATAAPPVPPTDAPDTPTPPVKTDICDVLSQQSCTAPCEWTVSVHSTCSYKPAPPVIKSAVQRQCDATHTANKQDCRLSVGEKIPITVIPTYQCEACVIAVRYIWCDWHNNSACFNNDFASWNIYPYNYSSEAEGLEIHMEHCQDLDKCGLIQVRAVAFMTHSILDNTIYQFTEPADASVYISPDDVMTNSTPSPAGSVTDTPATPSPGGGGSSPPVGIIVLVVCMVLVCGAAAAVAYVIKKRMEVWKGNTRKRKNQKKQEEEDESIDEELDDDELDDLADASDWRMEGQYGELEEL